jgi:hypothetical protein
LDDLVRFQMIQSTRKQDVGADYQSTGFGKQS